MNEEYKQIECISKMKKEYFDKFCTIVEGYREKISDNLVIGDSAFTLHDFDHHCFDIYKIISEVLFDEELVYSEKYGLSERELYIMNLAVLFHDIGMSNGLDRARDNHSLNSADYIDRQFKDSRSVLSQNSDLSANEIKALKAIIIAHSNLKDRSVQESDNGLKSHKLQDYKARLGIIRTRFLAGVLRLADELDVSVERLGTGELQQELEEQEQKYNIIKNKQNCSEIEEKQMEEWKGFEKSLEFWHKLHLVKHINNSGYDDYIIAGVDLVGTLLASRIAFTLQAPLTYIVPEKEKNVNAHQEIDLEIEKDKKVILITDAIVTFNTVKSAIEKNKLENSVICIYTMFYRESDYQGCAEYVDKTFSINNAFRIELFRKEKCTYNKTKCIASNRRLREGEDSTDESDRTQF